ncbi:histidine phosphatase family protein [Citrobacter tructae]|uniref:histidine phosphatase family protein n=1 Tax=Citrobacter tructae TaxID=2562449 RepID=UPI003F57C1B4
MLVLSPFFIKYRKLLIILVTSLALLAGFGSQFAWSSNGLPGINTRTLALLAKQHPVIVLIRHAQRCDRSDNVCLSDKTGITVYGAHQARARGLSFSKEIPNYDLYASDTVRTIQSATWFSTGNKVTVDKNMHQCGKQMYRSITALVNKSGNNNVVIFTHNHCLTWLAKNMRGVKYEPDYLDALVMHAEQGKLFLDGQLVAP